MKEKFPVVVAFDKQTLILSCHNENIKIIPFRCESEEMKVPLDFVKLLIQERTRKEAWRLLRCMKSLPLKDEIKQLLFRIAYEENLRKAKITFEKIKSAAPNGKPSFFAAISVIYSKNTWRSIDNTLMLTDGDSTFVFTPKFSTQPLKLVANVYTERKHYFGDLTWKNYLAASQNLPEFFRFVKKVAFIRKHVRYSRAQNIFRTFFTHKKHAYLLLDTAYKQAQDRHNRDEIFRRLKQEEIIKVSRGFLGYSTVCFYVSNEGRTYQLAYKNLTALKRAVFSLVQNNRLPQKLVEIPLEELPQRLAQKIGDYAPELLPILTP